MSGRLGRRVSMITGATSGIGEATARRFAGEGACVVAVRCRDGEPPRMIDTTVQLPSDVTFGGVDLDRLYFVSIGVRLDDFAPITSGDAGRLMVIDDVGVQGRAEPRVSL